MMVACVLRCLLQAKHFGAVREALREEGEEVEEDADKALALLGDMSHNRKLTKSISNPTKKALDSPAPVARRPEVRVCHVC